MTIRDELIGFVGLGHMGGALASTTISAGFRTAVFDVRAEALRSLTEAGATAAPSLHDLASAADVLSIVVVDDHQVRAVVHEALEASDPPRIVVVQSTVLPSTIQGLAAEAADQGVELIDAAVSGGREKAELGALTVMVGGPDEPVQHCWPYFEAIGQNVFHIGGAGTGTAAKLVNNVLTLGGYALVLEAMQLADAYGIDEDTVTRFVSVSSGDIRSVRTWGRFDRIRREHSSTAGRRTVSEMMAKDLVEGVLAAGERGVVVPLIAAAAQLLPRKVDLRDELLVDRGEGAPVPLCTVCRQELALPFRDDGSHPECRAGRGADVTKELHA